MTRCPPQMPSVQLLSCSAWSTPGVLRGLEQKPGHVPGLFRAPSVRRDMGFFFPECPALDAPPPPPTTEIDWIGFSRVRLWGIQEIVGAVLTGSLSMLHTARVHSAAKDALRPGEVKCRSLNPRKAG